MLHMNLMLGCTLLSLCNWFPEDAVDVGFPDKRQDRLLGERVSPKPVHERAYDGAILVTMAVPWICWYMYMLLSKLHLSTMLNSSSRTLCGMW